MAFATAASLQTYFGRDDDPFTTAEQARAAMLLDQATGVIENEAGQKLAQVVGETVTVDGTGTQKLVLPRWPVTAITSVTVTEDDETVKVLVAETDYTWSESGVLTRVNAAWPTEPKSVVVVATAGFAVISDDLKRVCLRLAAGAWDNPAGADAEQLGDRNVRWAVPGMELTAGERRIVSTYLART